MFVRLLLVFTVLAALVAALAYTKYSQIQRDIAMFSQPMPPPTVAAAVVTERTWEPTLAAIGTVRAVEGVDLNNEVAGQVRDILFESGALVKQGQILLQLEDDVDQADLEGLRAAERLAQIKLDRNRALLKDRAVAQGDVDETLAQLDQARALVKAKEATIRKKAIRAPFDGQLGIRQVNLGQYLAEGSAIVPLQALDPVFIDYALPERELAQLHVGQTVQARVAAYPDRLFAGVIQAIGPGIDQGTRNVPIRARFENRDLALRPGMFARVATLLPAQNAVLTLPREAIAFNTYGDSVFLIEERDGKTQVQRRQIRTGAVRGDEVAVLDGLNAGDRVVVAGQVKLTNGQEISIQPAKGQPDQAAADQAQPE